MPDPIDGDRSDVVDGNRATVVHQPLAEGVHELFANLMLGSVECEAPKRWPVRVEALADAMQLLSELRIEGFECDYDGIGFWRQPVGGTPLLSVWLGPAVHLRVDDAVAVATQLLPR